MATWRWFLVTCEGTNRGKRPERPRAIVPLLRRPIYAAERLSWQGEGRCLCYQLPKPLPNGQTQLHLKPEEFLDRLAMLLPRPREHRHSYHGVLAANARLRKEVVARAGLPINEPPKVTRGDGDTQSQPSDEQGKAKDTDGQKGFGGFKDVVSCWAMLLARIYDVFPLVCAQCGGSMRVLSFLPTKSARD